MTPVHSLWLLDVVDILLVAALFYRLLILVKGTRSAQMYVGLLVIVLVGLMAREFDLIAVKWIVDSLKTVWLIAFVILFQPELRHALAQFGRTRYFRSFLRGDSYGVLGEIVRGVGIAGGAPPRRADRDRAQRRAAQLRRDRNSHRRQGLGRAARHALQPRLAAARRRRHRARGLDSRRRLHPAAQQQPAHLGGARHAPSRGARPVRRDRRRGDRR